MNILSLGKVKDIYPVEFIEGDFYVTINKDMVLIFRRMHNDLWGCDFRDIITALREIDKCEDKKVLMTDMVTERERSFSTNEVRRAKHARNLMRQLGYPSIRDMIKMIVKGWMINIPVTVQDIVRAEKIYGPDVASLKGKTVKRKPREQPKVYVPRAMIRYVLRYILLERSRVHVVSGNAATNEVRYSNYEARDQELSKDCSRGSYWKDEGSRV